MVGQDLAHWPVGRDHTCLLRPIRPSDSTIQAVAGSRGREALNVARSPSRATFMAFPTSTRTWSCQAPSGSGEAPFAWPVECQPAVPLGSKKPKVHSAQVFLVCLPGPCRSHRLPGGDGQALAREDISWADALCQAGRDWASARAEASPAFHASTTAAPFSVSSTL